MNKLDRAFKIYERIKEGNYTVEFYFYLLAEYEQLLSELKSEV